MLVRNARARVNVAKARQLNDRIIAGPTSILEFSA
jgi:hypothetical protein